MHQIAFQVGSLTVHWFGVMVALGFLAGFWLAARRAPRAGVTGETILDFAPWLIIGGVIGGRALFVLTYWRDDFAGKPVWEIFMLQRGGLVFYGGLIGASLACIACARRKKLNVWQVADVLAPSLPLGYMFGRIGCLMNGCCFGRVCSEPWAIRFPNQSYAWRQHFDAGLVSAFEPSAPVHPTQIYDALLSLVLFVVLEWLFRRRKFNGQVFAVWLVCYAFTRSLVELFRGDYTAAHLHGGLTPAHLISIGILLAGAGLYVILRRTPLKSA